MRWQKLTYGLLIHVATATNLKHPVGATDRVSDGKALAFVNPTGIISSSNQAIPTTASFPRQNKKKDLKIGHLNPFGMSWEGDGIDWESES